MTYKEAQLQRAYAQYIQSKQADAVRYGIIKRAAKYIKRSHNLRRVKQAELGINEEELVKLSNAARGILREKTANQGSYQIIDNTVHQLSIIKQAAADIINARNNIKTASNMPLITGGAGALLGAGIGAYSAKDKKWRKALLGALAGAGIGGGLGMLADKYLTDRYQRLANADDQPVEEDKQIGHDITRCYAIFQRKDGTTYAQNTNTGKYKRTEEVGPICYYDREMREKQQEETSSKSNNETTSPKDAVNALINDYSKEGPKDWRERTILRDQGRYYTLDENNNREYIDPPKEQKDDYLYSYNRIHVYLTPDGKPFAVSNPSQNIYPVDPKTGCADFSVEPVLDPGLEARVAPTIESVIDPPIWWGRLPKMTRDELWERQTNYIKEAPSREAAIEEAIRNDNYVRPTDWRGRYIFQDDRNHYYTLDENNFYDYL